MFWSGPFVLLMPRISMALSMVIEIIPVDVAAEAQTVTLVEAHEEPCCVELELQLVERANVGDGTGRQSFGAGLAPEFDLD
ncbi:MAG: hypothetical protein E5W90_37260, partial [Mesorhizobium sp.]